MIGPEANNPQNIDALQAYADAAVAEAGSPAHFDENLLGVVEDAINLEALSEIEAASFYNGTVALREINQALKPAWKAACGGRNTINPQTLQEQGLSTTDMYDAMGNAITGVQTVAKLAARLNESNNDEEMQSRDEQPQAGTSTRPQLDYLRAQGQQPHEGILQMKGVAWQITLDVSFAL